MAKKTLYEVDNDGKLTLNLHEGQTKVWDSEARFIFMLAGTQGGKCVIIGTMILMADGSRKRIEDVRAGDQVLSLGLDLKIEVNTVAASFSTERQAVCRVITDSGRSVVVTAVHPLLGINGWTPAQEFKAGDWIGVPRQYPTLATTTADDKQMRLLGYLLGDGGLTHSSPIFTNKDEALLDDFRDCLPTGCQMMFVSRYDWKVTGPDGGRGKAGNNPLITLAREWGIYKVGSKEKRIPEFVFTHDNRAVAQMLRALFDCDATVDAKGIEICLASQGLIDDIMHLLLRFGIVARKYYKRITNKDGKVFHAWRLHVRDADMLARYQEQIGFTGPKGPRLDTLLATKAGMRPNGKDLVPNFPIDACYAALGKRGHKQPYTDTVGYELLRGARRQNVARPFAQKLADHFKIGDKLAYSDCFWDKVCRIEPLGVQDTWDLTVANGHNYIAQDVFCHNTSLGPWWLWKEINRLQGGDFLAVTSTYDLFKLKMLPELVRVYEGVLKAGKYWAGDKVIELFDPTGKIPHATRTQDQMWGRIILRSAVAEGGLESATAKAAWLDEAGQDQFGLGAWEAVMRRLSLHQGRALATTTLYNLGWIRQQIYKKWLAGDPEIDVIQFDSVQNPAFHRTEYERAMRDMPEWKFNMFYRGQFSTPPGQIYSDFKDGVHEVEPFTIPHYWPVHVGVDFGAIHTAQIWAAEDPETKAWFIYSESLEGGKTTEEHCSETLRTAEPYNVLGYFGGAPAESQQRMDWTNNGVMVQRPLVIDVESGIDRVIAMLRNRKLFVFNNCGKLLDEMARYSRKVTDTGDVMTEIKNKNDFHMCLVGETRILTKAGWKSLLWLDGSEELLTRGGWRPIQHITRTHVDATVWELKVGQRTLVGTGNHPIWNYDKGWVPLDQLRWNDRIMSCFKVGVQWHWVSSRVDSVRELPETQTVYNLAVQGDHPEYVAEGVLVHNCDALRYVCSAYELSMDWTEVSQPETMTNVWAQGSGDFGMSRGLTDSAVSWDDVWS